MRRQGQPSMLGWHAALVRRCMLPREAPWG
jgi:hypothetical protein